MTKHLTSFLARANSATPQSQPIPGSAQVANSAGGYSFAVDDWTRFHRFLILGSEGGSYYATERALTAENASATLRCIQNDGSRVVKEIVEISQAGRAPKNDAALFALALCASKGDETTRREAFAALPQVARTGTHLFHFAAFADAQRGWGRGLRNAIAGWYSSQSAKNLAYGAIKYQSRDGWSHRDLLRLSHPTPKGEVQGIIYHWMTQGWPSVGNEPHPVEDVTQIWAFERIKRASDEAEVAKLIAQYRLPREAVPTQFLNSPAVWEALLQEMPMTALIRNLATLTRSGLLSPLSETAQKVVAQLGDANRLQRARVHPIAILAALRTYSSGRGARGNGVWEPVSAVVDALDAAFYTTFGLLTPSGKRHLLALDVSGSMGCGEIAGVPGLTPREASAAMALVTGAVEENVEYAAFSDQMVPVQIGRRVRLDSVQKQLASIPMGGTDCALPMLWALKNKVKVDVFVVYTDSETWFGKIHPTEALTRYRQETGIAAKLIVVGMLANKFSIADPCDAGMLDVIGFDTAAPQLMSDFAAGAL
ncbi:MAG TPA: TROVE domain-containing protein [Abditibacterium sp.]|jgi:60 kDa SS-A/Ro ribonucleoprotein